MNVPFIPIVNEESANVSFIPVVNDEGKEITKRVPICTRIPGM